jgi:sulfopyruvate decarboxylase subunit beta
VRAASTPEELAEVIMGKGVVVAKVEAGNADVPVIDLSPEQIRDRFILHLSPGDPGL